MHVKDLIKNLNAKFNILWLLVITIILLCISYRLQLIPSDANDDMHFYHALDNQSIIHYLHMRYFSWTGRLTLEAIMVSTIKIKYFWKLAIPACFLLLCYSINKITFQKTINSYLGTFIVMVLCLLTEKSITSDAAWWITGFYNYLLPIACGMFSVMIIKEQENYTKPYLLLAILSLFIACYNEQVAICMLLISPFICVTRFIAKKSIKFNLIFIFTAIVNTAISFAAPGNYSRFTQEINNWLPEFADYSLMQKVTLGIDRVNAYLHSRHNILWQIICLLLLFLLFKNNSPWKTKFLASLILISNMVLFSFNFFPMPHILSGLTFSSFLSPENLASYEIYLSYFWSLATIATILFVNNYIATTLRESMLLSFYPLLGLATVMMLSFSPTIYASGSRILYLFNILLVMYICLLLKKCLFYFPWLKNYTT